MAFFQDPPVLGNPYDGDRALQALVQRLPQQRRAELGQELKALGELAGGELQALADQAEANPPRVRHFDAWGRRIDRIETNDAWHALHAHQARLGLGALPYEEGLGADARTVQHALLHLYMPSSALYSCPVAMTDGAVRVLLDHAPQPVRERVVPRLISRNPAEAWTAGQWMTERVGGSDVRGTETRAVPREDGLWELSGTKWFTSATTADCALALARSEGTELGLFLIERVHTVTGKDQIGDTIRVNRLKDKLGTRALPTAELTLDRAAATPIAPSGGLRAISGMLTITRVHNAISATALMRRAAQLSTAYARVRSAFGRPLIDLPLHAETLADLVVEADAAFMLTARVTGLLGASEHGDASEHEQRVLRALVPLAKLLTAKDAVAVTSEAIECFGGAGYVEDTGLPRLLRDAQVLPIWEGTTNVLALDLVRAEARDGAITALLEDLDQRVSDDALGVMRAEVDALRADLGSWGTLQPDVRDAGLRRFAFRLGRLSAAVLLREYDAEVAERYADRWLRSVAGSRVRRAPLAATRKLLS